MIQPSDKMFFRAVLQWKLIGNFAEEVAKRVDKKNKNCNNMCQQAEQNLRTIADKHDELNRGAETLKMEVEGGIGTLSGILDEREQVTASPCAIGAGKAAVGMR